MSAPEVDYTEQIAVGFIELVRRHPRMEMEVDGPPQWKFRDTSIIDHLVRQGRLEVSFSERDHKTTFRLPAGTPRYRPA